MYKRQILLGDPLDVETIAKENYTRCVAHFKGQPGWQDWIATLPRTLTAGECTGSLLPQEMHDYLNLAGGWQMRAPFCKGDEVTVLGTDGDYFKLSQSGPWMNVSGDANLKVDNLPCPSCKPGSLILRFKSDDGKIEDIREVGVRLRYTVPAHGEITVRLNDSSPSDNYWKVESGMSHHTGIAYKP